MLYLNPNKEKVLTFEVELSGADASEITGFVRFIVEGIEIGFPAHVSNGEIKAIITPLKNFLKKPLKNGTVFEAQLQLFTEDDEYFSPWKGEIEVKMPVTVEARLTDEKVGGRKFGAKLKTVREDKGVSPSKNKVIKEIKEEKGSIWTKESLKSITEEQIFEFMERAGTKNPRIQKIVFENAQAQAKSSDNLAILKEVVKALKKPKGR